MMFSLNAVVDLAAKIELTNRRGLVRHGMPT